MPVRPDSLLRSTFGLSEGTSIALCRVIEPTTWSLMLVFPLTVVAILYLLIEDTQYRPRILEVLIGANILMVLPFILNIINKGDYTWHVGIMILLVILSNPALYLSLVYVVDQSDAPEKKLTSNMLLGVAVTLSVLLVAPAVIYMKQFYRIHCTTRSFYP
jgi:hypothetical protein